MREKINQNTNENGNEEISKKTKYITYCTMISVIIFGVSNSYN